jgi:hypothetical protein
MVMMFVSFRHREGTSTIDPGSNDLLGVAVVSPPKEIPVPRELAECHARVKRRLGPDAMARFDRYNEACEATDPGTSRITLA